MPKGVPRRPKRPPRRPTRPTRRPQERAQEGEIELALKAFPSKTAFQTPNIPQEARRGPQDAHEKPCPREAPDRLPKAPQIALRGL